MENIQQTKTLLPVMELFKKSFDEYQKKIWALAKISLFSLVGFAALAPFALTAFLISYKSFSNNNYSLNLVLIDFLLVLIGLFLAIIFSLWSQVALYYGVKEQDASFKKMLALAWEKIGSYFWVSFLAGLIIFAGFVLFVVPGIIFSVWLSFSVYVFVWDELKGTAALKKSRELVRGIWWPVFWRIFAITFIVGLVASIKLFGPIVSILFLTPYSIVYISMLYTDLKRVKA